MTDEKTGVVLGRAHWTTGRVDDSGFIRTTPHQMEHAFQLPAYTDEDLTMVARIDGTPILTHPNGGLLLPAGGRDRNTGWRPKLPGTFTQGDDGTLTFTLTPDMPGTDETTLGKELAGVVLLDGIPYMPLEALPVLDLHIFATGVNLKVTTYTPAYAEMSTEDLYYPLSRAEEARRVGQAVADANNVRFTDHAHFLSLTPQATTYETNMGTDIPDEEWATRSLTARLQAKRAWRRLGMGGLASEGPGGMRRDELDATRDKLRAALDVLDEFQQALAA